MKVAQYVGPEVELAIVNVATNVESLGPPGWHCLKRIYHCWTDTCESTTLHDSRSIFGPAFRYNIEVKNECGRFLAGGEFEWEQSVYASTP